MFPIASAAASRAVSPSRANSSFDDTLKFAETSLPDRTIPANLLPKAQSFPDLRAATFHDETQSPLTVLGMDLETLEGGILALQGEVKSKEAMLHALRQSHDALSEKSQAAIGKLEYEIVQLQAKIQETNHSKNAARSAARERGKEWQNFHQNRLDEANARADENQAKADRLIVENAALHQQIHQRDAHITSLEEQLAGMQGRLDGVSVDRAHLGQNFNNQADVIRNLKKQITTMKEEREAVFKEFQGKENEYRTQMSNLRSQIIQDDKEKAAELRKVTSTMEMQSDTINSLDKFISQMNEKKQDISEELKQVKQQLQTVKKQNAFLHEQYNTMKEERDSLQRKIDSNGKK